MRNLNLAIILGLLAFSVTSCNPMPDYEPDPMLPGVVIFNSVDSQNKYSMHPGETALRLNVLLSEAAKPENSGIDLNKIEVELNQIDERLVNVYFDGGSVSHEGDGVYKITYTPMGNSESEINGIYIIDTGGKLLDEMENGDRWTIKADKNRGNYFAFGVDTPYYIVRDLSYDITPGDIPRSWDITYISFPLRFSKFENKMVSDWSGSYTLTQTRGTDFNFSSVRSGTFSLYGSSSGTIYHDVDMVYEIFESDPFIYYGNCTKGYYKTPMLNGTERAAFAPGQEYNKDVYPSPEVERRYEKTPDKCTTSVYWTYNGQTEVIKPY